MDLADERLWEAELAEPGDCTDDTSAAAVVAVAGAVMLAAGVLLVVFVAGVGIGYLL